MSNILKLIREYCVANSFDMHLRYDLMSLKRRFFLSGYELSEFEKKN
jgi:hypothetical protein